MRRGGKVSLAEDARADGVIDVVVHIRDAIGHGDDAPLEGFGANGPRMAEYPVAHLGHEVQASPTVLDRLDHAKALLVVAVQGGSLGTFGVHAANAGDCMAQRVLARVAERRVPQVMAERDGLGKIIVEAERPRDGARYLRNLQSMRETRAEMVALRRKEDLRFMRKPPKRFRMEDLVAVALEVVSQEIGIARAVATVGLVGERRVR